MFIHVDVYSILIHIEYVNTVIVEEYGFLEIRSIIQIIIFTRRLLSISCFLGYDFLDPLLMVNKSQICVILCHVQLLIHLRYSVLFPIPPKNALGPHSLQF